MKSPLGNKLVSGQFFIKLMIQSIVLLASSNISVKQLRQWIALSKYEHICDKESRNNRRNEVKHGS